MADSRVPEIPVIFVNGDPMSLLEAKSRVCQFLANQYPADLKGSSVAASEDVRSIYVFTKDIHGETN